MEETPIATLIIDKAWIDPRDKGMVFYNLVDPDDNDKLLVTPRNSKLGRILMREIREVEKENHPYGSAGDDSGEVAVASAVRGAVRPDGDWVV